MIVKIKRKIFLILKEKWKQEIEREKKEKEKVLAKSFYIVIYRTVALEYHGVYLCL